MPLSAADEGENEVDYNDDDDEFESIWNDLSVQDTDLGANSKDNPDLVDDASGSESEDEDGFIEMMDDGDFDTVWNDLNAQDTYSGVESQENVDVTEDALDDGSEAEDKHAQRMNNDDLEHVWTDPSAQDTRLQENPDFIQDALDDQSEDKDLEVMDDGDTFKSERTKPSAWDTDPDVEPQAIPEVLKDDFDDENDNQILQMMEDSDFENVWNDPSAQDTSWSAESQENPDFTTLDNENDDIDGSREIKDDGSLEMMDDLDDGSENNEILQGMEDKDFGNVWNDPSAQDTSRSAESQENPDFTTLDNENDIDGSREIKDDGSLKMMDDLDDGNENNEILQRMEDNEFENVWNDPSAQDTSRSAESQENQDVTTFDNGNDDIDGSQEMTDDGSLEMMDDLDDGNENNEILQRMEDNDFENVWNDPSAQDTSRSAESQENPDFTTFDNGNDETDDGSLEMMDDLDDGNENNEILQRMEDKDFGNVWNDPSAQDTSRSAESQENPDFTTFDNGNDDIDGSQEMTDDGSLEMMDDLDDGNENNEILQRMEDKDFGNVWNDPSAQDTSRSAESQENPDFTTFDNGNDDIDGSQEMTDHGSLDMMDDLDDGNENNEILQRMEDNDFENVWNDPSAQDTSRSAESQENPDFTTFDNGNDDIDGSQEMTDDGSLEMMDDLDDGNENNEILQRMEDKDFGNVWNDPSAQDTSRSAESQENPDFTTFDNGNDDIDGSLEMMDDLDDGSENNEILQTEDDDFENVWNDPSAESQENPDFTTFDNGNDDIDGSQEMTDDGSLEMMDDLDNGNEILQRMEDNEFENVWNDPSAQETSWSAESQENPDFTTFDNGNDNIDRSREMKDDGSLEIMDDLDDGSENNEILQRMEDNDFGNVWNDPSAQDTSRSAESQENPDFTTLDNGNDDIDGSQEMTDDGSLEMMDDLDNGNENNEILQRMEDNEFENVWNDPSAQETSRSAESQENPAFIEDALDDGTEDNENLQIMGDFESAWNELRAQDTYPGIESQGTLDVSDNALDDEDDEFESVWNALRAQDTDQGVGSQGIADVIEDALDNGNEDNEHLQMMNDKNFENLGNDPSAQAINLAAQTQENPFVDNTVGSGNNEDSFSRTYEDDDSENRDHFVDVMRNGGEVGDYMGDEDDAEADNIGVMEDNTDDSGDDADLNDDVLEELVYLMSAADDGDDEHDSIMHLMDDDEFDSDNSDAGEEEDDALLRIMEDTDSDIDLDDLDMDDIASLMATDDNDLNDVTNDYGLNVLRLIAKADNAINTLDLLRIMSDDGDDAAAGMSSRDKLNEEQNDKSKDVRAQFNLGGLGHLFGGLGALKRARHHVKHGLNSLRGRYSHFRKLKGAGRKVKHRVLRGFNKLNKGVNRFAHAVGNFAKKAIRKVKNKFGGQVLKRVQKYRGQIMKGLANFYARNPYAQKLMLHGAQKLGIPPELLQMHGGAPGGMAIGKAPHGVPIGGAPYGGVPTGGAPHGGVPTGGAPYGGVPTGQAPYGGVPTGQAPYGGMPMGGPPYGGMPMSGPPYGGVPMGGPAYGGMPMGGPPYGGWPMGGPPYGGVPMGGVQYGGVTTGGAPPYEVPMGGASYGVPMGEAPYGGMVMGEEAPYGVMAMDGITGDPGQIKTK